jgi:hypothetical protein
MARLRRRAFLGKGYRSLWLHAPAGVSFLFEAENPFFPDSALLRFGCLFRLAHQGFGQEATGVCGLMLQQLFSLPTSPEKPSIE